jgi:hypothetical protein
LIIGLFLSTLILGSVVFGSFTISYSPFTYNGVNYANERLIPSTSKISDAGDGFWIIPENNEKFDAVPDNYSLILSSGVTWYVADRELGITPSWTCHEVILNPPDPGFSCDYFRYNVLTYNGPDQDYTFDGSFISDNISVTPGYTSPPYIKTVASSVPPATPSSVTPNGSTPTPTYTCPNPCPFGVNQTPYPDCVCMYPTPPEPNITTSPSLTTPQPQSENSASSGLSCCFAPVIFLLIVLFILALMILSKPKKVQNTLLEKCPDCNGTLIQTTVKRWLGLSKKEVIACEECMMAFSRNKENKLIPLWKATQDTWVDKCPICKKSKVIQTTLTDNAGQLQKIYAKCKNCKALFTKTDEGYRLDSCQEPTSAVWNDYSGQTLSVDDWKRIADGGKSAAKEKEDDLEEFATRVREGKVPIHLIVGNTPIMLQAGEAVLVTLPNIALHEPRTVSRAVYGGPSVRVAKGLWFRGGVAQSESHEELRQLDVGTFTLTTKRLVFSGEKKTIEVPLNKIVSINPYTDGISLSRSGKERREYLIGMNRYQFNITINGRKYTQLMSGAVLVDIIEGLTKTN